MGLDGNYKDGRPGCERRGAAAPRLAGLWLRDGVRWIRLSGIGIYILEKVDGRVQSALHSGGLL